MSQDIRVALRLILNAGQYLDAAKRSGQATDDLAKKVKDASGSAADLGKQIGHVINDLLKGQSATDVFARRGAGLAKALGEVSSASAGTGSAVAAMTGLLGGAAAAAGLLATAYFKGRAEADEYRKSIILTGNAAGMTVGLYAEMARAISAQTGTQRTASTALLEIAASGKVARQNVQEFTRVAMEMERTAGVPVAKTAEHFAALAQEPLKASLKLHDALGYLTLGTYEQIRAAEEMGDKARAGEIASQAYAQAMSERTDRLEENLGTIERAWDAIRKKAADAWDAMLNVGREQTKEQQLAVLEAQLAALENPPASALDGPGHWGRDQRPQLKEEIEALREAIGLEREKAEAQAEEIRLVQERAELDKDHAAWKEGAVSKQARMQRDLDNAEAEGRKLVEAGLIREEELTQRLNEIREKYRDKGTDKAAREANRALEEQERLIAELSGLTGTYYKDLATLAAAYERGRLTSDEYTQALVALTEKQPAVRAARQEEEKQLKAIEAEQKKLNEQRERGIRSVDTYVRGMSEANAQLEFEYSLIGMGTRERETAIEQRRIELELAKQIAEIEANPAFDAAQRAEQIARASAAAARASANAGRRAMVNEYNRAIEQIDDVFRQGFADMVNEGTGTWKAFTKSLSTTFKTTVADQIYKAFAQPIVVRVIASMLGITGMGGQTYMSGMGGSGGGGGLGLGNMPFGGAGSGLLGGLGGSLGLFSSYAGAGSAALWSGSFGYGLNSIGALFGAGNIAGGLGMLTGFLGPIIAGISLISGLLSKSDPHVGATGWYETGKDAWNTNYQGDKYNADIGDTVQQFAGALGPMLEGFLRGFGIGGDVRVGTGWVDDFDGEGPSFGDFKFYLDGEKIIDWQDLVGGSKKFSPEEKGYEEFVAEVLRDAMSAIAEMDIAAWAKDQIGQLGASATLEEVAAVLQSIGLMQVAFGEWGKQVSGFATLTDAAISKLLDAAGGFDNLASGMSAYYQNFYSEEEQLAYQTAAITEALAAVGLTLPETRDGFRELVDAQMALGEEGAEALAALLGVAQAFANITPAAEDATAALEEARHNATDSAWSALQKSIAAERTAAQARVSAAQELVSELGSIFEMLGDNVRDLYQQVDSTRAWSAAQGRAFIRNALTGARTSGYLPDADELGQAIDAARSGIEASNFSTRSAYEIEQLKLAAELAELQDISGGQLSIAERELLAAQEAVDYLDKLLEQARMDYEVARGMYQALLDLPSAWQAFQDALAAERSLLNPDATPMPKPGAVTNNEGAGGGSGSGGGEGTGPYGGNATGPQGTPVPKPGVVEVEIVPMKDDSAWNSLQSILDTPASASAGDGSLQSKLQTLLQDSAAVTADDAALDKLKLPAFASGGAHSGGWRLVGEEGPELEFTAPAHIFNAQLTRRILQGGLDDATATGNAEVLAALQRQYELWVALGQPLLAGVADIESTLRKFDQIGIRQRPVREEATA